MKQRFQVTNAADGLVLWDPDTKLVLDRDGSYFDTECKDRGDVCGYDMHIMLSKLAPARPEFAIPGVKPGAYVIEVEVVEYKQMPTMKSEYEM
jgi:hypothetical protein